MPIRKIEIEKLTAQLAEIGVEAPPHTSARELSILLTVERVKRGLPPVPPHPRLADRIAPEVADRLAAEGIVQTQAPEPGPPPPQMQTVADAAGLPVSPTSAHSAGQPPPPYRQSRRISTAEHIVRNLDYPRHRQGRHGHVPPDGSGSCRDDLTVLGATPNTRGGWM